MTKHEVSAASQDEVCILMCIDAICFIFNLSVL